MVNWKMCPMDEHMIEQTSYQFTNILLIKSLKEDIAQHLFDFLHLERK